MSWCFQRLFTEVIDTKNGPDSAINWMISKGLLPASMICECGQKMRFLKDVTFGSFRCARFTQHSNRKEYKIYRSRGTLFERSQIAPDRFLILLFCFACEFSVDQTLEQLAYHSSKVTVYDYFRVFRETIAEAMFLLSDEHDKPLGGDGGVVEIFDAKILLPKSRLRKIADEIRFFGMNDLGSPQYRIVICPDGKNDAESLIPFIQKNIAAGTIVLTKQWKEYATVDKSKCYQFTNNLSCNPETGMRIQQEVATNWKPLKKFFPSDDMGDKILEYIFRHHCKESKLHVFDELVKAIQKVYPGVSVMTRTTRSNLEPIEVTETENLTPSTISSCQD